MIPIQRIEKACYYLFFLGALIISCGPSKLSFKNEIIDGNIGGGYVGIADLNNDKIKDLIFLVEEKSNSCFGWCEGPGFTRHYISQISEGVYRNERPFAADIDGDGDLDLVIEKWLQPNHELYWFENPLPQNTPESSWQKHYIGTLSDYAKDIAVCDFDKDGLQDVVVRTLVCTHIWFQNRTASWTLKAITHPDHEGMDIADMDMDGDPDIVLNGFWLETPLNARNGDYALHPIDEKWYNQTGDWRKNGCMVVVADIDSDGRLDVVLSQSELGGYPVSWYGATDPKGEWQEHIVDADFGWCQTLKAADIDQDGDVDLFAGRFARDQAPLSDRPFSVRIYVNQDGKGRKWSRNELATTGIYNGLLSDIDNDGDLDVICKRSYWRGPIEFWLQR